MTLKLEKMVSFMKAILLQKRSKITLALQSKCFFLSYVYVLCICAGGRGWIWGGCSDNVDFGENISKQFVDALENGHDSRAAVNRHNNEVGRLVSPNSSIYLSFVIIDYHVCALLEGTIGLMYSC